MAGLALAVVSVAVIRLVLFGWATVAPDDARYVFVGLSTLAGHGPVTPDGNLFLLRSPVYGIALAAGGHPFEDPLTGARIVAATLALTGLIGAIRLGWLIGGPLAAAGSAVALVATPLIWRLMPTIRIDLPQTAGLIWTLIALQQATARRWALAGVILGLTILVKETILLLVALPVAAVGLIPARRLARLWAVFVIAIVAIVAWWWVIVWVKAGVIFPANAIGTIEKRDVGTDLRIDPYGIGIVGIALGSWLVVAWRARRELPARLLIVAAACVAVPAIYATLNGLNARNYANLAVLSAIAVGVAVGTVAPWLVRRAGEVPRNRTVAWVLIAVLLMGGAALGQRIAGRPSELKLPPQIALWLRPHVGNGDRVVMTFLYSEVTAVSLFGSATVPKVPIVRDDGKRGLDDYLWLGFRDKQLFGMRRALWTATITAPATTYLVFTGPHALTPDELLPAFEGNRLAGIKFVKKLGADNRWAEIFVVDPAALVSPAGMALHMSPETADAWLDMAGDAATVLAREQQLIDAQPVLVGRGARALLKRIVPPACLVSSGEGSGPVSLISRDAPNASLPGAVCD